MLGPGQVGGSRRLAGYPIPSNPTDLQYVRFNFTTNQWEYVLIPPGGEVNLGANVGTGAGLVFRDKTGVTLNFKTLIAGTNISLTNQADDIIIAGVAAAPNTFARVVKTGNQTNNTIVFVDDTELFVDGLVVAAEYGFLLVLFVQSSVAGGLQVRLNGDSGISSYSGGALGLTPVDEIPFGASSGALVTNNGGQYITIVGKIRPLVDPSEIQFAFRQNVADAGPTLILAGSYLVVWENLP